VGLETSEVTPVVYTVFYYSGVILTRAIVYIISKILGLRRFVREVGREEKPPAPSWGWFESKSPLGYGEITWVGKSTSLIVSLPQSPGVSPVVQYYSGKPPVRLYFTFREVASKEWFKEIEELAKRVEEGEKHGSEGGE
jgi:hypothetical protein